MDTVFEENCFTSFRLLPVELRLKIWRYAQPFRILHLRLHDSGQSFLTHSNEPLLTLLATNHESRQEALKSYTAIHSFNIQPFYFNSYRDVLYFAMGRSSSALPDLISQIGLNFPTHQIRNLAIFENQINRSAAFQLLINFAQFTQLEELFIILNSMSSQTAAVKTLFPRDKAIAFPDLRAPKPIWDEFYIVRGFIKLRSDHPDWKTPRVRLVRWDIWSAAETKELRSSFAATERDLSQDLGPGSTNTNRTFLGGSHPRPAIPNSSLATSCYESKFREHTLKSYVAIHEFFVPRHFYINAARDTLHMSDPIYSFDLMLALGQFGSEGVGEKLRSLALPRSTVESINGDLKDLKIATYIEELFVTGRAYGYDSDTPGVEMLLPRRTRPGPDGGDLDQWSLRGQEGIPAKFEALSKRFLKWNVRMSIAVTDEYWAYKGVDLRGHTH